MRVDEAAVARRVAAGRAPQPVFALVSARLDLDPTSTIFTDAPVRPIVVTVGDSPADRRAALADVADVLICGDEELDTRVMVDTLVERGLNDIHCEGGPHLFGAMVAGGSVDELCLTISPLLEGGRGGRISAADASGAAAATAASMRLEHALVAGSTLLLRYVRPEDLRD
jgi:riboflavin biosynthesis pyrimidine reductase